MPLLEIFETAFGAIRISRDNRNGRLFYYQNGCFHSQAERNGVSITEYIHAIHEIIRQARARDILIIGGAGGTLATMLRRMHCKVTVVDINPAAFVIAKRYFHLPAEVRCIRRDGIAYLRHARQRFDAVVVDVFGSNNNVPKPFTTVAFFKAVAAVFDHRGIMVMNVIARDDDDRRADDIALNAQAAGMKPVIFDWPGETDRNALIVGGTVPRLVLPSGHEPKAIADDMVGIVRRRIKKYRT